MLRANLLQLDAKSRSVLKATSVPTLVSGWLLPYDGSPGGERCTCSHRTAEINDDGFGTAVVEVTVATVPGRSTSVVEGLRCLSN